MILPNNQLWVTSIDFNNAIEEDFDLFIYGNDTAYVSISTGFQYYWLWKLNLTDGHLLNYKWLNKSTSGAKDYRLYKIIIASSVHVVTIDKESMYIFAVDTLDLKYSFPTNSYTYAGVTLDDLLKTNIKIYISVYNYFYIYTLQGLNYTIYQTYFNSTSEKYGLSNLHIKPVQENDIESYYVLFNSYSANNTLKSGYLNVIMKTDQNLNGWDWYGFSNYSVSQIIPNLFWSSKNTLLDLWNVDLAINTFYK